MADFFEALHVSYKNKIDIVPVCGIGELTYELFYAAVSQHFHIKNRFCFVHTFSGAEIKREFFVPYVKRYEHNLILVVKEDVTEENVLPTNTLCVGTQTDDILIKEEPQFEEEILLENSYFAADSDISSNETGTEFEPSPINTPVTASYRVSEKSCYGKTTKQSRYKKFESVHGIIMSMEKETVAKYMQNPESLTNFDRIKISKTIINHLLNEEPTLALKLKDYQYLIKIILSIFNKKTESGSIYYTPAINGKPAKGKLFNAYHNKKNSLSKAGLLVRRKIVRCTPKSKPQSPAGTMEESSNEYLAN